MTGPIAVDPTRHETRKHPIYGNTWVTYCSCGWWEWADLESLVDHLAQNHLFREAQAQPDRPAP